MTRPHAASRMPNAQPRRNYRRRQGNESPRRRILIYCEGRRTEPEYFRALHSRFRSTAPTVWPKRGGEDCTNAETLLRKAGQARNNGDLEDEDEVWCVFDAEVGNGPAWFDHLTSLAKELGVSLAVTNPAFEYWYLLHYERTNRSFASPDELRRALTKHVTGYSKSQPITDCIGKYTYVALENAAMLRSLRDWSRCPNPSTGVDLLVARIVPASVPPSR